MDAHVRRPCKPNLRLCSASCPASAACPATQPQPLQRIFWSGPGTSEATHQPAALTCTPQARLQMEGLVNGNGLAHAHAMPRSQSALDVQAMGAQLGDAELGAPPAKRSKLSKKVDLLEGRKALQV
jgi:hypothetical protein